MAIIGIDVGGSGIKGALVDTANGELIGERVRVETPRPSKVEAVVDAIEGVVGQLTSASGSAVSKTSAVGVTFPGVVIGGHVRTAANVDKSWIGVDLASLLKERLGRRTVVLNDADAAGLAEVHHGAARGVKGVVILLTFGTGIGSAGFLDGKLMPNTELGHLEWDGKIAESRAAESVREAKGWSWKQWAKRAAEYVDLVDHLFSPGLVVIGGGVANKPERWMPHLKTTVTCVPAAHANQAGIIGAAAATVVARSRR